MGRSAGLNSTCMTERKEGAATTNTMSFNPEIKMNLHRLDCKKSLDAKAVIYVPFGYVQNRHRDNSQIWVA